MNSHALVIDGRLVTTTEQDPVVNPATGEPFATASRATAAHVEEAMAAASRAFAAWRTDEAARRNALKAAAGALKQRAEEIATLLSKEQGKPLKAAVGEVQAAAAWFSFFAALPTEAEVLLDDEHRKIQVARRPLGVVAAITPWNFPLAILSWKLAPALLAGNTVVAKPSPFTPLSSLLMGEVLSGVVPPGVVNVLSGGNELGALLVQHPTVRKVSFTGSVGTGKRIAAAAAEDLKRVTLELGGNDPAIVLADADPAKVVDKLFWGAFANSGQVCVAIKRLYVHEDVYEPIVNGLVERAQKTRIGDGLDPQTQLGPINNQPQLDKLGALVDDARAAGAKIETGGARPERPGYFYPPTIVTGAQAGMRLVDEEQFGTALPIIRYRELDDALLQANRSHFGLGGSVWTSDLARGEEVVQSLECGTGWVNHHQDLTPLAPFGGFKHSGLGVEGGRWGYHEFTAMQVVNTRKK